MTKHTNYKPILYGKTNCIGGLSLSSTLRTTLDYDYTIVRPESTLVQFNVFIRNIHIRCFY